MKLLKKLFYTIIFLIMAGCLFILICALNPSLTETLASAIQQVDGVLPDGMAQQEDGMSPNGMAQQGTMMLPDGTTAQGTSGGTGTINGAETTDSEAADATGAVQVGYIAPSEEGVLQPDAVSGKTGYEPVQGEEEQVSDEAAKNLQDSLSLGELGENLTFDTLIYPYYGMLDQELQQLYRQIYANAMERNTSFAPVITVGINRVKDVVEAVYNDHPELFWVETEYSCKYNKRGICLEITLKYNDTAKDLSASQKLFEAQAQAIVQEAAKKSSDYEKELFVHDALVKRVDYNANATRNQSAYSALVEGKSVCAGYARAFQYLMQQLSIPCYYCTGYSGDSHAWNIVKLDGRYVNVDVTWDDTNPSTYDYFNKTDIDYAGTHVRKGLSIYLPACNGAAATNALQEVEGSDLDEYINPNPIEPLNYPSGLLVTEGGDTNPEKEANLKKAGITEEEVLDDMQEYYADCLKQLTEAGTGQQYFQNVIPKSLWLSVEQAYSNGAYEKGYVTQALEKLKMENFAIQLQVDDIGGGYYRIYHSIVTW